MRIHTLLVLAPVALALALASGCGGKKAPVEPSGSTDVSEAGSDMPSLDSGSSMAASDHPSMDAGSATPAADTPAEPVATVKDAGGPADAGKKAGNKPKPGGKPGRKP